MEVELYPTSDASARDPSRGEVRIARAARPAFVAAAAALTLHARAEAEAAETVEFRHVLLSPHVDRTVAALGWRLWQRVAAFHANGAPRLIVDRRIGSQREHDQEGHERSEVKVEKETNRDGQAVPLRLHDRGLHGHELDVVRP